MRNLEKLRNSIALSIARKLVPDSFCIISDDCYGGQIYRKLQIPYTTPFVGMGVREPGQYFGFLKGILNRETPKFEFYDAGWGYPVARCFGSIIHFKHYKSVDEAMTKFWKRYARINWDCIRVKVDFCHPIHRVSDIEIWNEMKIPNAVAFYEPATELPESGVYNGVLIRDHVADGAKMFNVSRKYFDIFKWVRTGEISNGIGYRMLNALLLDPTAPERLAHRASPLASPRSSDPQVRSTF